MNNDFSNFEFNNAYRKKKKEEAFQKYQFFM